MKIQDEINRLFPSLDKLSGPPQTYRLPSAPLSKSPQQQLADSRGKEAMAEIAYGFGNSGSLMIICVQKMHKKYFFEGKPMESISFATSSNLANLVLDCQRELYDNGFEFKMRPTLDVNNTLIGAEYRFQNPSAGFQDRLFDFINALPKLCGH
jgi:hypothetical protein